MRTALGVYLAIPVGCLDASCLAAEVTPPACEELLRKFAANQDKQQSFILKCEDKTESTGTGRTAPFLLREVREVRTDGERCYIHTPESQGNDGIPNLPVWRLWDGRRMFTYSHSNKPENDYLIIDKISPPKANLEAQAYDQGPSRGYLSQEKERVDSILRQASQISVRQRTQRASESDCWIIDAVTSRGKYTLWIDPPHGYNLAKADVVKREGDRHHDTDLAKGTSIHSSVVNTKFSKVDGLWVPTEAESTFEMRGPEGWFLAKTRHKILEIGLNPDHQKLDSFALMPIRNGTKVVIAGAPKTPMGRWQNGAIIDPQGNRLDLTGFGYDPLPKSSKVEANLAGNSAKNMP